MLVFGMDGASEVHGIYLLVAMVVSGLEKLNTIADLQSIVFRDPQVLCSALAALGSL